MIRWSGRSFIRFRLYLGGLLAERMRAGFDVLPSSVRLF